MLRISLPLRQDARPAALRGMRVVPSSVRLSFVLLTALLLSACSATSPFTGTAALPASFEAAPAAAPDQVETVLRSEVAAWQGTPYRYGGTDRDGIDCSAFVQNVYGDALGVTLPRTTELQGSVGEAVDPEGLRPGDLVFFRPSAKASHVGIYLSNGEFAHASQSQGVTVSRLSQRYWREAFDSARRILPEAPSDLATAAPQQISGRFLMQGDPLPGADAAPKRERIGW